MLTVKDALELDVFQGARCVAGHDGLSKPFNWVHNVGVPDAAQWLNGGEFVLTTAINMPPSLNAQEHYLRDMIAKGVVALGISVGQYLETIPSNLRAIADEHAFPLIEVPYKLLYVEIAREINRMISQRELKQALHIHHALTRLVIDGGGLKELADTLAALVNQSVSIEAEDFSALASVNLAAVDEARRYTQKHGRTDPRLVQALKTRGFLQQIRNTLRPVGLPQMPDVGLEMERILAPIIIHGEVIGYMWIIADGHPFTELEHMAIESGATVAALMMLRQDAMQREEATRRGDLLNTLMQADDSRAQMLTDRVLRYGVDLRQPYRVLLIDCGEKRLSTRQTQQINHAVEAVKVPAIVGLFAGQPVIVMQNRDAFDQVLKQFRQLLPDAAQRVGVSAAHRGAVQVAQAHEEAREALYITARLDCQKVAHFDQLGYLYALYKAGHGALIHNPDVPRLKLLLDERTLELFETLEAYLDAGGNGVATAEALHIHRSTLNYRLTRIGEIIQADLSQPMIRTNLQIAIKLMRLFEGINPAEG